MSGRKSNYVQWQDWCEWQRVHAALFSNDLDAQQRALTRVAAWRTRAQLPVAIAATSHLLEIQLHERMAQQHHHGVGVATRSHMELSLQYASAVVRCVNGLVDGSQKGTYAMAVSSLAQRIGIPLWIVDLRHDSTHNQLPSLPVLRFAAQHLLAWLRSNYWFKQEELLRAQVRLLGAALHTKLAASLLDTAPVEASSVATDTSAAPPVDASSAAADTSATAAPPTLLELLDIDKVRNVIVPLLVTGEQYGEQIAPTGLLFTVATHNADTTIDEQLVQYPRDALATVLLELQSVWPCFSAWLLSHLCRKVFQLHSGTHHDDVDMEETEAEADNSAALAQQQWETEVCLLWITLLVANDWRERLKFAAEPIDALYVAGAEMLCRSTDVQPTNMLEPTRRAVFDRLQAALRSCKGIRTSSVLVADAALRRVVDRDEDGDDDGEEEDTNTVAPRPTWTALPAWNACPLGMRSTYGAMDVDSLAFSSALDSLDGPLASSVYAYASDAIADDDDAMLANLDAAYDARVEQTLTLKDAVVQHVIREGQSVHQKLLPQDELMRLQSAIEIW